MDSRIPSVRRAVILAAGKSTRLGGANKLLVEAGGAGVHRWHERLLRGIPTTVVTRSEDVKAVSDAAAWARVMAHDETDGPVGALRAYLSHSRWPLEELIVLFADTLLPPQPLPAGSWVGVAPAPARTWDLPSPWGWTRGKPYLAVCVGIYAFSAPERLHSAVRSLEIGPEVPFSDLLQRYAVDTQLHRNTVRGWHDAGDPAAIAAVPNFHHALFEDPEKSDVVGWVETALTR